MYDPIADMNQIPVLPVLRQGATGAPVRILKRLLHKYNMPSARPEWGDYNARIDSEFNAQTHQCVREFQQLRGLDTDGIVGPKTWAALGYRGAVQHLPPPTAPTGQGRVLALIADPRKQRAYRKAGFAAVQNGDNACASVACRPYIELGIIAWEPLLVNAEYLCDKLEATGRFVRISDVKKMRAGDLMKCKDLKTGGRRGTRPNGMSDHVWHALSDPDHRGYCQCFDNDRTRSIGYQRNIGAGPRTPVEYALRLRK